MPVNMPWMRVSHVELPFVWESVSLNFLGKVRSRESTGKTNVIPHICGTHEVGADIISPLELICYSAVVCHFGPIIDEVVACEQRCLNDPVVGLVGPIGVRLVTGISSQTCGQLEEAPVRYTVLVVISVVPSENLPSKSSTTCGSIPSAGLFVEYRLG